MERALTKKDGDGPRGEGGSSDGNLILVSVQGAGRIMEANLHACGCDGHGLSSQHVHALILSDGVSTRNIDILAPR